MRLILMTVVAIFTPYLLLSLDGIYNDNIPESAGNTYGVIYGSKVDTNGELSNRLRARLDAGYDLYKRGLVSKLIVSGGVGIEGFDEAIVMKNYLEKQGVDIRDVFLDSDGYTTKKTSNNVYKMLGQSAIVVGISQWYHISRVKLSLKHSGFENIYGYAPKYFELRDIYSIFREFPAYVMYLYKG